MNRKFTNFTFFFIALFFLGFTAQAQLSGTYTIGSGGTYSNFSSAVSALYSSGVNGNVTFNVLPGTYTEYVYLNGAISGAGPNAQIVFDGGSQSQVTLQYSGTSYATIRFYGADYVTFKNMTIKHTSSSRSKAIHFRNGADHNTIYNCYLQVYQSSSSNHIVVMFSNSNTSYSSGSTNNGNYNRIEGNTIRGGYIGLSIYGSGSNSTGNHHNEIIDNEFVNNYYYGIRSYYGTAHLLVKGNKFHNFGTSSAYCFYQYYGHSTTLDGNIMNPGRYGMYIYRENYYFQSEHSYITNNMIFDFQYSSYQMGIYLYYYNYNVHILHNSIECKGSSSSYSSNSCIYAYYYPYYSEIKNNILSAPNYYGYCLSLYYPYYLTVDGNNYYYPSSHYNKFYANGYLSDFNAFKNYSSYLYTPHDQNSITVDPQFTSSTDLHLSSYAAGNTQLAPSVGLDHDIDNDPRPLTGDVMIGADQYVPPVDVDIEYVSPEIAVLGNNSITVKVSNRGSNSYTLPYLGVDYKIDNGNWVEDSIHFTSSFDFSEDTLFTFSVPWNISVEGSFTVHFRIDPAVTNDIDVIDVDSVRVGVGMQGTYTINPNGSGNKNFVDFNSAVSDLEVRGVTGPVVFQVAAGTYNEQVTIEEIMGANSTNTVTFKGASKNSTNLNWTGLSQSNRATLVLDGADFIHFKDMKITNDGNNYAMAIFMWHQADSNVFSNLNIEVPMEYSTSGNMLGIMCSNGQNTWGNYANNGNYNLVENCHVKGGRIGIIFTGDNGGFCYGNKIIGNHIEQTYDYGTLMYYQRNPEIRYNKIEKMSSTEARAIGMNNYNSESIIDGNILHPGEYGIYLWYENYSNTSGHSYIMNNIICNFSSTTYQKAITTANGTSGSYSYNLHIYNNSIHVNGTEGSHWYSSAICLYYPYYPVIKNNILVTTGRTLLVTFYSRPNGNATIDNNAYYYPNRPSNYWLFYSSSFYRDVEGWKTETYNINSPHDENSYDNMDPHFLSSTDLHLDNTYPPLKGEVLPQVVADVDGDPRCPYENTLGADESQFPVPPPVSDFISAPNMSDTLCFGAPLLFVNLANPEAPGGYWWYVNNTLQTRDFHMTYQFGGAGSETVSLVTENCGGIDTFTKVYTVDSPQDPPITDFFSNEHLVETFYPIEFYDLSTNCPTSWEWKVIPDTIMSGGLPTPTHDYYGTSPLAPPTTRYSQNPYIGFNFPGKYEICLTATNAKGSTSTCKTKYITVKAAHWLCLPVFPEIEQSLYGYLWDDGGPAANYSSNLNPPCELMLNPCASEITFNLTDFDVRSGDYFRVYAGTDNTGTPLWNTTTMPNGLGNNMTMTSPGFQQTFVSNTGTMFFEFQSDGSTVGRGFEGEWEGVKGNFQKGIPSFEGPDTVCVNTPVTFTSTSTGDNLEYAWDFDNDGFFEGFSEVGTATYFFAGTFTCVLRVSNCGGDTLATKTIVVVSPTSAPTPDFSADIRRPVKGFDIVSFTDESMPNAMNSAGCADYWSWVISPTTYSSPTGTSVANPQIIFNDTGYYDITLVVGFGGITSQITKTQYIEVIDYCKPQVNNLNPDIGISRVMIGDINNTSSVGLEKYTDFSNTQSTPLDMAATYPITIERNTMFNDMNLKAWIDFNNDGDFEDQGEMVVSVPNMSGLSYTGNIYIPLTAQEGATRLRVGTSLAGMSNTPCGTNLYGEFEDYRVIFRPDATPPVITLIGPDTLYYDECTTFPNYADSATAMDNVDGNITSQIQDTTFADPVIVGLSWTKYTVADNEGNTAEAYRAYIMNPDQDDPTLTLLGNKVDTILVFNTYTDPGYTANDACSGIDTVMIQGMVDETKLGAYTLVYTAYDMRGNYVTDQRTVYVIDDVPPVITLVGAADTTIEVFDTWGDPWVLTSDNYWYLDPAVNAYISSGYVDENVLGDYTLTYTVKDSSGNTASVSRTIHVVDVEAPEIVKVTYYGKEIVDGDTMYLEVYNQLELPDMEITDNYYDQFTTDVLGDFYATYPGGVPTSLGSYSLIIKVYDGSNNLTTIEFLVMVRDTESPEIMYAGADVETVCRFQDLTPDSAWVVDNYDNNLTVQKTGTYYTEYLAHYGEGFYTIHYDALDNSGNVAEQVTRYVYITDCNLGVNTGGLEDYVALYPNPNTGIFMIDLELPSSDEVNITIQSIVGQIVETRSLGRVNSGSYEFDISNLSDGLYFVKIQTGSEVLIKEVLLTK